MAIKIVNGLLPVIAKKETTFGEPVLDFTDHDGTVQGLPINQSVDSPINVTDSYNKEVIQSTFGSQIQKEGVLRLGNRSVATSIGHSLGLNDFVVVGNMFFQNGYTYTDIMANTAIVSVVDNGTTSTIEVGSTGSLENGFVINLEGRTVADENGDYTVSNVTATTFDITYTGFTTDVEGTVESVLGVHESLIEDVNDCNAQGLENSYSFYLPEKFPDNDSLCGTSQGEVMAGVVPTTLSVDFVDASYSADFIGKSLEDYGTKSPRVDEDYKLPSADGFMRQNFATLQSTNDNGVTWNDLDTMSLDITVTLGTEDSQKVRKAGELSRALVDGVMIEGNYNALYLTEDEANKNISNSIYGNRADLQSGGLFRIAVKNSSGEAIYIEGNIKFYNETLTKELGGFLFATEFQFLRSEENPNIKLTCINNYNEDLSSYL